MKNWDVIVIGGGHSGYEASFASANMGSKTLLLTMKKKAIGKMSCNPAIGGIGKGHLVKEIDALGGIMGLVADETAIQFRLLNTKKGSAVQATRCQSDMYFYSKKVQEILTNQKNLVIAEKEVVDILWKEKKAIGVLTSNKEKIYSQTIILTGGTFLRGKIYIGEKIFEAGRTGEAPANQISLKLAQKGINFGRLKTGTTPRIDKNTINWNILQKQESDIYIRKFSFWNSEIKLPQLPCYITYTNEKTHYIIEKNLKKSAMYNGNIKSLGPRYCPSIEDKIFRFPEKNKHQIFLEPTALDSIEIYPNGISTSLSEEVQKEFLHTIEGLEKAKIIRAGYAVEYDFAFPKQLQASLELKEFENLFFAGQINGTTGYEEAAAQGLVAGINASRKVQQKDPIFFTRDSSYIGVLIDDLVTKGTEEPYRMFTSRCEYRLLLREDNADQRLCELGYKIGLLGESKYRQFCEKQEKINNLKKWVQTKSLKPDEKTTSFCKKNSLRMKKYSLESFLKQPNISFSCLEEIFSKNWQQELKKWNFTHKKFVENALKYEGYIKKQQKQIVQYQKMNLQSIPKSIDYEKVGGLSNEVREKLNQHRPENLAHCLKISGITPAAVGILMVYLKTKAKKYEV